jgi:hypothetical protein
LAVQRHGTICARTTFIRSDHRRSLSRPRINARVFVFYTPTIWPSSDVGLGTSTIDSQKKIAYTVEMDASDGQPLANASGGESRHAYRAHSFAIKIYYICYRVFGNFKTPWNNRFTQRLRHISWATRDAPMSAQECSDPGTARLRNDTREVGPIAAKVLVVVIAVCCQEQVLGAFA